MDKLRLVLADVQILLLDSLKHLFTAFENPGIVVVGSASDKETLDSVLEQKSCDILFLDLNLPGAEGLELLPKLRDKYPDIRICVLTAYTDYKFVKEAFQHGVDGYFSKLNSALELQKGINEVMKGQRYLSSGLYITPPQRKRKIGANQRKSIFEDRFLIRQKLTRREQEVLELITKAMNNKEIAAELYISDQTVGVHRKNIMRKLGVRNTVNLIKFAMDHELV